MSTPIVVAGSGWSTAYIAARLRASWRVIALSMALDLVAFSSLLGGRDPIHGVQLLVVPIYALLGLLPLAWRREQPLGVFALLVVHALAARLLCPGYHPTVGVLVALHAVSETAAPVVSLSLVPIALISDFSAVSQAARQAERGQRAGTIVISLVGYLVLTLGAWGLGQWSRRNRGRLVEAERRRRAEVEAERARANEALIEERARIAREMHDIVANSVTVMVLHSGSAARWLDKDTAAARASLSTIESAGRQATDELRRMLQVLTETGLTPDVEHGLHDLPQLVASFEASGVEVAVRSVGNELPLDPSIELAAFRVVQEGLTNILRHCGPGTVAEVICEWGSQSVVVRVEDNGGGTPDPRLSSLSSGHGLLGLRERVQVAGGTLEAGPTPRGGFSLVACLPASGMQLPVIAQSDQGPGNCATAHPLKRPSASAGIRRAEG